MSELLPAPVARRIRPGDWTTISGFRCSSGAWFEDEAERFVRTRLRAHCERRAAELGTTVILLGVAADPSDILAIGAHELDDQRDPDGNHLEGSYLIVGAVRTDVQGAVINVPPYDDGRPVTVGRHLMEVLLDDLPDRPGVVRATVARENTRSLRLCTRIGAGRPRRAIRPAARSARRRGLSPVLHAKQVCPTSAAAKRPAPTGPQM